MADFPELKALDNKGNVYTQFVPLEDITPYELCWSLSFLLKVVAGEAHHILMDELEAMPDSVRRHWEMIEDG